MPRPVKSRRICGMPEYCCFAPQENCSETVTLTVDEYEAIMLMYGKEASNRKQEIDRQHYTIPNQRPKDKHCGKI